MRKTLGQKRLPKPASRGCYGLFDPLFIVLSLSIDKAHLDSLYACTLSGCYWL